jgi:hypothetical protein
LSISASIDEAFKSYRSERKEELSELANILYSADVCVDTGPLNSCVAACLAPPRRADRDFDKGRDAWWGYELTDLRLLLPAQRHFRPRRAQTDGLTANLCVTVEEYVPREADEVGRSFALARRVAVDFYFDSVVDLQDGGVQDLRTAWHIDTHVHLESRDVHPRFHFQFGGDRLDGIDESIRAILVPEAPRLPMAPMDAVLAVDFVLSHYFGALWKTLRDSNPQYRRLVHAATLRYWTEYFALVTSFMTDPENESIDHPALKLLPNLI